MVKVQKNDLIILLIFTYQQNNEHLKYRFHAGYKVLVQKKCHLSRKYTIFIRDIFDNCLYRLYSQESSLKGQKALKLCGLTFQKLRIYATYRHRIQESNCLCEHGIANFVLILMQLRFYGACNAINQFWILELIFWILGAVFWILASKKIVENFCGPDFITSTKEFSRIQESKESKWVYRHIKPSIYRGYRQESKNPIIPYTNVYLWMTPSRLSLSQVYEQNFFKIFLSIIISTGGSDAQD